MKVKQNQIIKDSQVKLFFGHGTDQVGNNRASEPIFCSWAEAA